MKENTTNLEQSDRERELQMYPLDSWAIITKKQNENEKPTMNLKRSYCLAGGERREIRIGNVKVDVCVCILLNTYYFHTYIPLDGQSESDPNSINNNRRHTISVFN